MTALLERIGIFPRENGTAGIDEPTTELPELSPGFDRDPEPAPEVRKPAKSAASSAKSAASSATSAKQKRTGGRFVSTRAQQGQVADEIDMMLKLLAMTWSLSDDHCAPVLNEHSAAIAADLARLVSRSDWLMEHVTTGGLFMDIIKLSATVAPVVKAIWAHHRPGVNRADVPEEEYEGVTVAPDRFAPYRPNIATA